MVVSARSLFLLSGLYITVKGINSQDLRVELQHLLHQISQHNLTYGCIGQSIAFIMGVFQIYYGFDSSLNDCPVFQHTNILEFLCIEVLKANS